MNHREIGEEQDLPRNKGEMGPLNEHAEGSILFRKMELEDEGQKHLSTPGRERHEDTEGNKAFPLERAPVHPAQPKCVLSISNSQVFLRIPSKPSCVYPASAPVYTQQTLLCIPSKGSQQGSTVF